ncbi:MAG: hypothetical protein ACOCSE_06120, partial [Chitinivibrionales bacterium]
MRRLGFGVFMIFAMYFVLYAQAPVGEPVTLDKGDKRGLEEIKEEVEGKIVWSSSRSGSNHDIWIMNADGTEKE